jgi:hypothetical protein
MIHIDVLNWFFHIWIDVRALVGVSELLLLRDVRLQEWWRGLRDLD